MTMYVHDEPTTTRYRDAIVAMGFSPRHAALVQVDLASRETPPGRRASPRYRVTTGTDVVRRGETIRRVLMLWYVYDEADMIAESQDRDALADMVIDTIGHLPERLRGEMPAPTGWALDRLSAPRASGHARRAA
jgi:hypothetical protein